MAGATSFTIADTVETALEAAHGRTPNLILSDVNLLRGDRGPDAVAQIRSAVGIMPVIFITATAADCVDCDYANAGASGRYCRDKVGRNDLCSCGSGRKYKKRCGLN